MDKKRGAEGVPRLDQRKFIYSEFAVSLFAELIQRFARGNGDRCSNYERVIRGALSSINSIKAPLNTADMRPIAGFSLLIFSRILHFPTPSSGITKSSKLFSSRPLPNTQPPLPSFPGSLLVLLLFLV